MQNANKRLGMKLNYTTFENKVHFSYQNLAQVQQVSGTVG